MNIGDKIKIARIGKGLTQQELGDLLGVQKSAIAKYENGRVVNIKRSTLKKISEILEIKPSELIFEEGQKVVSGGAIGLSTGSMALTAKEFWVINKYRMLDDRGKRAVNAVLSAEYMQRSQTYKINRLAAHNEEDDKSELPDDGEEIALQYLKARKKTERRDSSF